MKKVILTFLILLTTSLFSNNKLNNRYAVITIDGAINPVVSTHVEKSINDACKKKLQFIVIQLDTPGGLITSMRKITKSILTSSIPVVVFTFPKGGQATSAGGFIMLSAHVAVMAPGTEIGAMHPVSPALDFVKKEKNGTPLGIMEKKVLNDTIAQARSLAQKRGRNVKWVINAVKNAKSSTYLEAKKLGIIDFIAEDMNDLLKKLNNYKLNINGKIIKLQTKNITPIQYKMNWKESMLNRLADPQTILFLFLIAIIGLGIEFKSSGMIIPGTIGAISLFLFLMAIQIIPINFLGLALIILSIILFILELNITSFGLLTLGGIISFIAGSLILFDSTLPGSNIPLSTIVTIVIFIIIFVFTVIRKIFEIHKSPVSTGIEGLKNETGTVLKTFNGSGKILIHGEIWNAISDEEILEGTVVAVEEIKGMNIIIKTNKLK